jgi:hypothetical protein
MPETSQPIAIQHIESPQEEIPLHDFVNDIEDHYVKTSNRSRNICNGPLTPVTCTHICNGCCLAPVTYMRDRPIPGLASTTLVQCGLLVTGFLNAHYINSL